MNRFFFVLSMDDEKEWTVSIIALRDGERIKYKVTRRLPALHVAETKVFSSKATAKRQFEAWLRARSAGA